jgi:D-alanyl-D-alanine carboxypeptidase/D-alanyl-D-alanine-endopeptidase (penicillin-binding protein 4)
MSGNRGRILIFLAVLLSAAPSLPSAEAAPRKTRQVSRPAERSRGPARGKKPALAQPRVAVAIAGALRTTGDRSGVPRENLSVDERTADAIEGLYATALRAGRTSLYVADARTGKVLFSADPEARLNPASNVKLLSTAAALHILGPDHRYTTQLFGPAPTQGTVSGDVYLLGTYDPLLHRDDLRAMARDMFNRGVRRLDGNLVVGPVATRDGLYRSLLPITVVAGKPGARPTVSTLPGYDFATLRVTATTAKGRRGKLGFQQEPFVDEHGQRRLRITVSGRIGRHKELTHWLFTEERQFHAAHLLRAALREVGIEVNGGVRVAELLDYTASAGFVPEPLTQHASKPLAEMVAMINKRSINWLADRVIMTAAAKRYQDLPSMEVAIRAMKEWIGENTAIDPEQVLIDTGSGLSYNTRISAQQLVEVLRAAAGFSIAETPTASAYLESLAIAGRDGTLRGRFRQTTAQGHVLAKTGTLSNVIALSGIIDVDPTRPLAFALVSNGHSPRMKTRIRNGHEKLVGLLCDYATAVAGAPASAPVPSTEVAPPTETETADAEPANEPDHAAIDELIKSH